MVGFAQQRPILSAEIFPGQLLVQLAPDQSISQLTSQLRRYPQAGFRGVHPVVETMRIWQIDLDTTPSAQPALLALLRDLPGVQLAQPNHRVTNRNTPPNDSLYSLQWQYHNTGQNGGTPGADMNIGPAWDFSTGGLNAYGDTLVVCIIDDGLDLSHTDFGDNLWVNRAEIPHNNLDDDNNGYIDDYMGWNSYLSNDDLSDGGWGGGHGTPVAGIVGAKGNNIKGIAGVNWNIKLMIVVRGNLTEAEVLAAYAYPLAARKRYNATSGAAGAYVVATNASWGVDLGQPSDAPLWCAMYDSLGQAGILNCGATANASYNVDLQGDLPSGCASNYLLTVTNLNNKDNKVGQAAYGINSIDLGSYGDGTFTVADGNDYGAFGGTSGATPHVTGTVALLYAAPCPVWAAYQRAHPDSAALLVKQAILSSTTPNASLAGRTLTGGKINAGGAMLWLMDHFNCLNSCFPPANLRMTSRMPTTAMLRWSTLGLPSDSFRVVWRAAGAPQWTDSAVVTADSVFINGLSICTPYEAQVSGFCQGSRTTFSGILRFKTNGCTDCAQEYCPIIGNSSGEWIESISIDNQTYSSGNNGGYAQFSHTFVLHQQDSLVLTVTPGFASQTYNEQIRVWADYNNDGDYDDADELVFDPGYAGTGPFMGLWAVPAQARVGITRMRVAMQYNLTPPGCGTLDYGEAEDYCLNILEFVGTDPARDAQISLWPQPATGGLHVSGLSGPYTFRLIDMQGRVLNMQQLTGNEIQLPAVPSGAYIAEFEANGRIFYKKCMIE